MRTFKRFLASLAHGFARLFHRSPYPSYPAQLRNPSTAALAYAASVAYPANPRNPRYPQGARRPLPPLDDSDDWQRHALKLADDYGVIAHRLFAYTARGAGVRIFIALVIGDGHGHACSPEDDYQVGVERYVRVDPLGRVVCECPHGGVGEPCGHAGAILRHVLAHPTHPTRPLP
jgi:catechol 2,3-dioxygenase-like lactoylglutathione lyase family enzyme